MDLASIHQCLCDRTRLRILHALSGGPLCVGHLQEILGEPQVKISKHFGYLKRNGLVEQVRQANWVIYRLPATRPRELSANLACLHDCVREDPRSDGRKSAPRRSAPGRSHSSQPPEGRTEL